MRKKEIYIAFKKLNAILQLKDTKAEIDVVGG